MSCTTTSSVLRLSLLTLTLIVTCTFIASVVWLVRTKGFSGQYESYYLSRINVSAVKSVEVTTVAPNGSDHYKDLVKIEIAMRRVEENSRRLREYTKSLLWDNKDKSLWCVLFKDNENSMGKSMGNEKRRLTIDEEYIRVLREQKMREAVIHLRHHGNHHRRRPDVIPNMPYIK